MSGSELGRVVAIVQARMGSSRLPGKVLAEVAGLPVLTHVLARSARIASVDRVVLATTTAPQDEAIAELGRQAGFAVTRGHPTDVLDRYRQAAIEANADVIVRVTGDCPLLDPQVSERALQVFLGADGELDFVANRLPDHRTYPIGLDTEICSRPALETAWREAKEPHQREHVMPFLYENPERFRVQLVDAEGEWGHLRWTVDTPEDLEFVRAIYQAFSPEVDFGWQEVLALLAEQPELRQINAGVEHRSLRDVDQRLESAAGGEG